MSRPVRLTIIADPASGQIQINGPLVNLDLCHALLMRAQAHLFQEAKKREPGPERKIQTLDEVGVAPGRRG